MENQKRIIAGSLFEISNDPIQGGDLVYNAAEKRIDVCVSIAGATIEVKFGLFGIGSKSFKMPAKHYKKAILKDSNG